MSADMKPCPFCEDGGDVRAHPNSLGPDHEPVAVCERCGASLFITKWNRRRVRADVADALAAKARAVTEWAEHLGYFRDEGTELAPVFREIRAALAAYEAEP